MKSGGNILVKGPMRGIYSRRFPGQLPGQIKKALCTRPGKVGNALKERTGVLFPCIIQERTAPVKKGKVQNMSTKDISQLAKELKELTRMKEELDAEITALLDSIKAEMLCRGVDELTAGEYKIRWTAVTSNRFDSTAVARKVGPVDKVIFL